MGKGQVTLGTDDSLLDKGLKAAEGKFKAWGKAIGALGAGIAAAGAAITGPMLYGLSVFSEIGGSIVSAARITGMATDDIQTLAAALKVDFDELAKGSRKMDQFISHAAAGAPEATRRLGELNLSLHDLASMSEADRFRAIGAAIGQTYSDISQRHAAALQIFGRGGLAFDFSGDVGGREQRRRELGGVMSPADLALAKDYNLTVKEMKVAIEGLWARIGATAAPVMRDFFRIITTIVVALQRLVDANRPFLETVFRVADALVTAGAVIVAIGGAFYGLSLAISFFGPMLGAIGIAWRVLSGVVTGWGLLSVLWTGVVAAATLAWGVVTTTWTAVAATAMGVWSTVTMLAMMAVWAAVALSTAVQAAWGVGTATVYAIAAAAVWAWSIGSIIAIGAYKTAMFLAAVATGVYGLATGGLSLAMAAQATWSWLAAAGSIAYQVAILAASAATFIYSIVMWETAAATTVATAGINILAAALIVLAVAALAAAGIVGGAFLIAPLVLIAIASVAVFKAAIAGIGATFAAIGNSIASTTSGIGAALGGILPAIGRIGSTAADAASRMWASLTTAFAGLVGTARTAWSGIVSAFEIGDFDLLWQIITAAAQVAWLQIQAFLIEGWAIWKFAGLTIFNEITDTLYDAFTGVWTELRILFAEGWAAMKQGFFEALVQIVDRWNAFQRLVAAAADQANPLLSQSERDRRSTQRLNRDTESERPLRAAAAAAAAEARGGARARIENDDDALEAAIEEFLAREERDQAALAARNAPGDPEAAARLEAARVELGRLADFAEEQALLRGGAADDDTLLPGGLLGGGKGQVYGTFSAQAAFGQLGTEAPAARQARLTQAQTDAQAAQAALLLARIDALIRVAGARFA